MSDVAPWMPIVGSGLIGVLIGTFLRPVVDEWFAKRRKTLHVIVTDTPVTFHTPTEDMKVDWAGIEVDRIILTNFVFQNRTGRTLRNVRIGVSPKSGDVNHNYEIVIEEIDFAKMQVEDAPHSVVFAFDYIEPKARIKGRMISDQTSDLSFEGLSDIELRRTDARDLDAFLNRSRINSILAAVASALGVGAIFSAIAK